MRLRCEDVVTVLQGVRSVQDADRRRAAEQHLAGCENCQHAMHAFDVLQSARREPIPRPTPGAMERALQAAARTSDGRARTRRGFWLGTVVGGALAATLVLAIVGVLQIGSLPGVDPIPASAVPQIALAINETKDVNIALDSPERLAAAEIHVVLTGQIGLRGFEGQRELRWLTDLDRGVNQLTLPIVALGTSGGQLMVAVQHGEKRRTFIVDVHALG